ncbi:tape measure protein [Kiritimatiellaeota bacterium B1221]|nr:tape measure protein [Kiritimatiellaeota bacterium B1221]
MAGDLEYKIEIDNSDFRQGLDQSRQQLAGMSQSIGGQAAPAMKAATAVKALAGSYLGLAAARKAVAIANQGLGIANSVETETVRLKVLLGSMQESEALMNRVLQKAGETPLQTGELQQATRMLVAFGSNSKDVIDELTRLGDISSGVGMEITDLAEIYGKARVQGTLFAEDINQLTGRGIPVISQFAEILGVTEGEVKKLASEGKVGFAELEEAIRRLTDEGGQFAGMMEEMSQTGEGALSTLKDNFDQLVLIPMGEWVKGWLDPMVNGLNEAADLLKRVEQATQMNAGVETDLKGRFDAVETPEQKAALLKEVDKALVKARISSDAAKAGWEADPGNKESEDFYREENRHLAEMMSLRMELLSIHDSELIRKKKLREEEEAEEKRLKLREASLRAAAEIGAEEGRRKKEADFEAAVDSRDSEKLSGWLSEAQKEYERFIDAARNGDILDDAGEQAKVLLDEIEKLEAGIERIDALNLKDQEAAERLALKNGKVSRDSASIFRSTESEPEVDRFARLGLFLGSGRDVSTDNRHQKTEALMEKMESYLSRIERNTSNGMSGSWS